VIGRDHPRAGEPRFFQDRGQRHLGQEREEEKETAKLCAELSGGAVERADIGDRSRRPARLHRAILVGAPRQAVKAFGLHDQRHGDGTAPGPLGGERAADVIDRQVLFAERDDGVADAIAKRRRPRTLAGGEKERARRILAKLMTEDAEAAGGIAETARDLV